MNYRQIGLSSDGDTIVIKKLKKIVPNEEKKETVQYKIGVILDTETSGLNPMSDHVIELAFIKFLYNELTGGIVEILTSFDEFHDHGITITPEITKLTNITQEMVSGKKIDWLAVDLILSDADIFISFNAEFDRPFVEKYLKSVAAGKWGCAYKQINWDQYNFPIKKQETLCQYHGFFYDAHRAVNDCEALFNLLTNTDPETGSFYLKIIIDQSNKQDFLIIATKTLFTDKPHFNKKNYWWNSDFSFWFKYTKTKEETDSESQFLQTTIYTEGRNNFHVIPLDARTRFKHISVVMKVNDPTDNTNLIIQATDIDKYICPIYLMLLARDIPKDQKVQDKLKKRGYTYDKDKYSFVIYLKDDDDANNEIQWVRTNVLKNFKGQFNKNLSCKSFNRNKE